MPFLVDSMIALGAEGVVDIMEDSPDWIREATQEECSIFIAAHPKLEMIDAIGRPYYIMVLSDFAPSWALDKCRRCVRAKYLQD